MSRFSLPFVQAASKYYMHSLFPVKGLFGFVTFFVTTKIFYLLGYRLPLLDEKGQWHRGKMSLASWQISIYPLIERCCIRGTLASGAGCPELSTRNHTGKTHSISTFLSIVIRAAFCSLFSRFATGQPAPCGSSLRFSRDKGTGARCPSLHGKSAFIL